MTWVLFKGARSHEWSFFGRSGETGRLRVEGQEPNRRKKRLHERERSETTNFGEKISD